MRNSFLKLIVLSIIISLIFIPGCNKKEEKKEKVIKIGVIMSLTGNGAEYGKMILNGMKIAKDDINKNLVSKKIELIIEDDGTEPRNAVNAAKKLINIDKVKIILGPIASSAALAVAPICQKKKVLMLSPAASTPKLSNAGDFIFRIYPSDSYDGKFLSNYIIKDLNIKKASLLFLNNDFGIGLSNAFTKNYKAQGGIIEAKEFFLQGNTDFRKQLTKIKNLNPKVLFIIATVKEYIIALKQIKELQIETKVIAPVSFDNIKIVDTVGTASEGVVFSRPSMSLDLQNNDISTFVKFYTARYKNKPSILSAFGYDSLKIFQNILKENIEESMLIKNHLLNIKNYNGLTGLIKFDKNGDVEKDFQLIQVKNGKFTILRGKNE